MRIWAALASISLTLSVVAVAFVSVSPSFPAHAVVWRAAEAFASPGEFLWWAGVSGAFAGYPTGASGHLIWALGTAVFWFIAASPFVLVATHLRKRRGQR